MRRPLCALVFAVVVGGLAARASAQPYTLIHLGTLPGQDFTTCERASAGWPHVRVRAKNAIGVSAPSAEIAVDVP